MKFLSLNFSSGTLSYGADTVVPQPPPVRKVRNERYENLPLFDSNAAPWLAGRRLLAVQAHECTLPDALVPGSVQVKADGRLMELGRDFQVNERWGTVGRLPESRITPGAQVCISYAFRPSRIDAVWLDAAGHLMLRIGKEGMAHPAIPAVPAKGKRLANLFWHGECSRLTDEMFFPVTETAFPADLIPVNALPGKTIAKLKAGKSIRILAWGDSVTQCSYLLPESRWQEQFCRRLRKQYPASRIELISEGWGGRTSAHFLETAPGEPHHFAECVLAVKPDLIISEFVNDCGLPEEKYRTLYPGYKEAFDKIGAEWIILTPHYVRPDWMGLSGTKNCDEDPRHFVHFLREFTAENHIPLADASRYWGRLYRQGIPADALYSNGINHPLEYGLSLFADALMKLF